MYIINMYFSPLQLNEIQIKETANDIISRNEIAIFSEARSKSFQHEQKS